MDQLKCVLIGPTAARPTGMVVFAQEAGTWVLTAIGYSGAHPPTEWEAP